MIGVIMNQMTIEDTQVEQDNIRMIELMTRVPVLGMIPYLENPLSAFGDSEMLDHLFSKLMEVYSNE